MAVRFVRTRAGTRLVPAEIALVQRLLARWGRVMFIAPGMASRDLWRRDLASAGAGVGIDVLTGAAWIAGSWELWGDGRHLAVPLERRLLMTAVVSGFAGEDLAPLRANPGTVRLLCRIAQELLPFADGTGAAADEAAVPASVIEVLAAYRRRLDAAGLIEPSCAAVELASSWRDGAPAHARCVVVRDAAALPAYLLRLLASVALAGEVVFLLSEEPEDAVAGLAAAFIQQGCEVVRKSDQASDRPLVPDAFACARLRCIEAAGPHVRRRAYADELARLAAAARDGEPVIAVAPCPEQAFDELALYLAARGLVARCSHVMRCTQSEAGIQIAALTDLAERMRSAETAGAGVSEWWPAPELADWLYSPLSGMGPAFARDLDKRLRSNRALNAEGVVRLLQSAQGRARAYRSRLAEDHPWAAVPAVAADVFSFIMQGRPVSACKAMLTVAEALPVHAWPATGGMTRALAERDMLLRMIELAGDTAHRLGVDQACAVASFDGLYVPMREERACPDAAGTPVVFCSLEDAATLAPSSAAGILMLDMDTEGYPVARVEGSLEALATAWGAPRYEANLAARQQERFLRALEAAGGNASCARVTHDAQAKDRYPAALWTELVARAADVEQVAVGEEDVVRDFDPAGAKGLRAKRVTCLPPQELSASAIPYVELKRRPGGDPDAPLEPRPFSASQIEAYACCPLCWFMSSRVRPQAIDASFGNLEKGNFVHDVLYRFYQERLEAGEGRVTPGDLEHALDELRSVFARVRGEHERGKTSSSAPLVPLDAAERRQVDDILPQLEGAIRFESSITLPYEPELLEYSFNKLDARYAGRPLGGRIDRVDVDPSRRALIIDYKHRGDVRSFTLKDPTLPDKDGSVAADDPSWLPEHTQSLIYARVLERELGLDVRGALYFATKRTPQMRGAVSSELVEVQRGEGPIPGIRDGFPGVGGSLTFEGLLDRVEDEVGRRLDELEAGVVAASAEPSARCTYNHPLGFERRDA